jgi:hypothetical protein
MADAERRRRTVNAKEINARHIAEMEARAEKARREYKGTGSNGEEEMVGLVSLAVWAGIAYVAFHLITKFW